MADQIAQDGGQVAQPQEDMPEVTVTAPRTYPKPQQADLDYLNAHSDVWPDYEKHFGALPKGWSATAPAKPLPTDTDISYLKAHPEVASDYLAQFGEYPEGFQPGKANWGDVARSAETNVGAGMERIGAAVQESTGSGKYSDARAQYWQAMVLPDAVRWAQEHNAALTDDPLVQQAAEHVYPDLPKELAWSKFAGDWKNYAGKKDSDIKSFMDARRGEMQEGQVSAREGAKRRELAGQTEAAFAPAGKASFLQDMSLNLAGMAPELLGGAALSMIPGGALPAAAMLAGDMGLRSYSAGRDAGLNDQQAKMYGVLSGAAMSVPEVPLFQALSKAPGMNRVIASAVGKQLASTGAGKIAGTALNQGITMSVMTALQEGIDRGYLDKNMSLPEALRELGAGFLNGTVMGGAMGGLHVGSHRLAQGPRTPADIQDETAHHEIQQADTERRQGEADEAAKAKEKAQETTKEGEVPSPAATANADALRRFAAGEALTPTETTNLQRQGLLQIGGKTGRPMMSPEGRRAMSAQTKTEAANAPITDQAGGAAAPMGGAKTPETGAPRATPAEEGAGAQAVGAEQAAGEKVVPAGADKPSAETRTLADAQDRTELAKGTPSQLGAETEGVAPHIPGGEPGNYLSVKDAQTITDRKPEEIAATIPRNVGLDDPQREIESRFVDKLAGNLQGTIDEYQKLPQTMGGKIISTDEARHLSEDYNANPNLAQEVHEPASWLANVMFKRALQQPPKPGEDNLVLFTGGGTGSGKSSTLERAGPLTQKAQLIYDTVLNGSKSAHDKIDAALQANKWVAISFVYRDAAESFENGTLFRAGLNGRVVPAAVHLDTHTGAPKAIRSLMDRYKGDDRVQFVAIDNSLGDGKAQVAPIEPLLDKAEANRATITDLDKIAQEKLTNGEITPEIYERTMGKAPPSASARGADAAAGGRAGTEAEREHARPQGRKAGGQKPAVKFAVRDIPEDAPMLNIGMNVGDPEAGGRVLKPAEITRALKKLGVDVRARSLIKDDREDTTVLSLARALTDVEATGLAKDLGQVAIAQRQPDTTGTMHGPGVGSKEAKEQGWDKYNAEYFKMHGGRSAKDFDDETKVYQSLHPHMTDAERTEMRGSVISKLVSLFRKLPDVDEHAAMSLAGAAKKGWYDKSTKAIGALFGPDAPRFTAFLTATSPQQSIEANLHNALHGFQAWRKAGRPTSADAITKIMEDNFLSREDRKAGESNLLPAWVPNAVRALRSANPEAEQFRLSGPKVQSFFDNLRGRMHEVTNDTWQAVGHSLDPSIFGGRTVKDPSDIFGKRGTKGPGYVAASARTRQAAKRLSQLTGERWTPAEAQETMWSFVRAAFEHAAKTGRDIPDLIKSGDINDDLINSTPDFASLLGAHTEFLRASGLGKEAAAVAEAGKAGPATAGKARAAAAETLKPALAQAGERLERKREESLRSVADRTRFSVRPQEYDHAVTVVDREGNPVAGDHEGMLFGQHDDAIDHRQYLANQRAREIGGTVSHDELWSTTRKNGAIDRTFSTEKVATDPYRNQVEHLKSQPGAAGRFLSEFADKWPDAGGWDGGRLINGNVLANIVNDVTDTNNRTAYITNLTSLTPGHGEGTRALRDIIGMADKHGITLDLNAVAMPGERGGPDQKQLVAWYKRAGFKEVDPGDPSLMRREPNATTSVPHFETNAGKGISPNDAATVIRHAERMFPNAQHHLLESIEDAPHEIQAQAQLQGVSDRVAAAITHEEDGTHVYLVRNNAGSIEGALQTLVQEHVGHEGMAGTFGEGMQNLLDGFLRNDFLRSDIAKAGRRWGLDINNRDQVIRQEAWRAAAEEWLAHSLGGGNFRSRGPVDRVITEAKLWLASKGLPIQLGEAEARAALARAHNYVTSGRWLDRVSMAKENAEIDRVKFAVQQSTGNASLDSLLGKIGAKPVGWRSRLAEMMTDWRAKRVVMGLDRLYRLKQYESDLQIPPAESGYIANRLATNVAPLFRNVMEFGGLKWTTTLGFDPDKSMTPDFDSRIKPLNQILAPLMNDPVALRTFEGYLVSLRADQLRGQGRENLLEPHEIQAGLALGKQYPHFVQMQRDIAALNKNVLDFVEKAGVIDPESRKMWESDYYVPFYRLTDDTQGGPWSQGSLARVRNPIMRLTGGKERLDDITGNIARNMATLINAGIKAHAVRVAVDNLSAAGVAVRVPSLERGRDALVPTNAVNDLLKKHQITMQLDPASMGGLQKLLSLTTPQGDDIVQVWRGGQREYYRLADPLLSVAFTAMRDSPLRALGRGLMWGLTMPKFMLTKLTTENPAFGIRTLWKDNINAWTVGRGVMPVTPVVSAITGLAKTMMATDAFKHMAAAGATFNAGRADPYDTNISVKRYMTKQSMAGRLWDGYRNMMLSGENASRITMYENTLKETGSHKLAAYEARDLMDYAMRGASPVVQFFVETVPFWGAHVQGLYKTVRATGGDDVIGTAAKAIATRAIKYSILSLAAAALYTNNRQNPEYNDLPPIQKELYYHLYLPGGMHIKIPKAFESGTLFGTVPEAITETVLSKFDKQTMKEQGEYLLHAFGAALNLAPRVTALTPLYELATNKDTATGYPILSEHDQGIMPKEQAGPGTSPLVSRVARAMPDAMPNALQSPKQLQHLILGYFGIMGSYALNAADFLYRSGTNAPAAPNRNLGQIPVVGSFVSRSDEPASSTKSLGELSDVMIRANQLSKTITDLEKKGDEESLQRAQDALRNNLDLYIAGETMKPASEAVRDLQTLKRQVQQDTEMSSEEKRAQVNEIQKQINDAARGVYEARPGGKMNRQLLQDITGDASAQEKARALKRADMPALASIALQNKNGLAPRLQAAIEELG